MSLVHGLYEQPHEALQTLVRDLRDAGRRLDVPSNCQPPPFSPRDPEVAVVPFVTLDTPFTTLLFILAMIKRQSPGIVDIWEKLEISRERCGFELESGVTFSPTTFAWARVKFDAHRGCAPHGRSTHPLAGLIALTALACHPERLRRMVENRNAGIWLPGLQNAPKMDIPEWDVRVLAAKRNVLRIGRYRRFPTHAVLPSHEIGRAHV